MSADNQFTQKLNKTIVYGKLDASLIEDFEDIETVDEDGVTREDERATSLNIEIESIVSKLNEADAGLELNRYETASLLESVNNDEFVLMVKDVDLDRVVEAHVLNQDRATGVDHQSELIHEALILSGLDHPGIPPIYDLNIASNQLVYCTLKHIEGFPLSSLCERDLEHADERVAVHDTLTDIVANFIKISEIIQYAHQSHVIHRNIKPDNLIIDDFGQIYVTAWGNAFDTAHDQPDFHVLRGTPLYMSPEQASCETLDHRSDIYSLGACLFHVLFKRPHLMRDDFDEFLEARKQAQIDDLSEIDDIGATAALLSICKRCLAPVESRIQDMDELINELKKCQAAQQGVEFADGERGAVPNLRTGRLVKWLIPVVLVVLAISYYAYQSYLQRYAGWGAPIYTESFEAENTWADDWAHVDGSFDLSAEDGRVVTDEGPGFIWFYKRRLHGGAAIEFEGEMLAGSAPGDLSIIYAPDPDDRVLEGAKPHDIYYLQHGAVGNACSMIEGPRGRLDYTNKVLEHGVRYKIRGEIEGKRLNLYLDSELICSYELLFPLASGYIGLYAYYDGKAIDNINIYNRELPEVTNIVKMGDLLYEHGLHKPALEHYQRIIRGHEGTALGMEGVYKSGLCYYHMDEVERAFEVWKPLEQSQYFAQINFYRWKELERKSDYHALLRQMYSFYRSADERLRVQIREQWGIFLYQVRRMGWKELTREFLRFRDKSFPDDQIFSAETYAALLLLDMPDKALELFPEQPKIVTVALNAMGEFEKVRKDYPQMQSAVVWSLLSSGQSQRIIDEYSNLPGAYFEALMQLGLIERAEKEFADQDKFMRRILMKRGAYDEVIKRYPDTKLSVMAAMLRDGNGQLMVDFNPDEAVRSAVGYDAITGLFLDRFAKSDETVLAEMYEKSESVNYYEFTDPSIRFHRELLPDILSHLSGDKEPLSRTLNKIWTEKKRILQMRHWHNVGLLLGKLDKETYMAQSYKPQIQSEYYFYAAIHHDLQDEKEAALDLYRAYQVLPLYEKRFSNALSYKKFVAMRIKALE